MLFTQDNSFHEGVNQLGMFLSTVSNYHVYTC